jgi:hypothetical protein
MKSQDILIALKIQGLRDRRAGAEALDWSQRQLAKETGVSLSQVNAACRRLEEAGLLAPGRHDVIRPALLEFLVHGLRYAFPVATGQVVRGLPTGYAAAPLKAEFLSSENELVPVWPDPEGTVRGMAVRPLYRSVPGAARKDHRLYEYLALIDAIRGGRARERSKAIEILKTRLGR